MHLKPTSRGHTRTAAAVLAAAALIGGAAALAPTLETGHASTQIRRAADAVSYTGTLSNAGTPVTVYSYPGNGSLDTSLPVLGSLPDGAQVGVQCYLTGVTPITGPGGQGGDSYWDEISTAGDGIAPSAGGIAVVPDAFLEADQASVITALAPPCPAVGLPAPATATATPSPATSPQAIPFPPLPPLPTGNDQGPGQACVFDRASGAGGLGHTGWGWEIGSSGTYVFGATEGVPQNPASPDSAGTFSIPAGQPNGSWHDAGTWTTMLATFANPQSDPQVAAKASWAKPYTSYQCEPTPVSNVGAASAAVTQVESSGYCGVKLPFTSGNCLDHTIEVLTAYGATRMPSALTTLTPNNWFNSLPPPWGPITSL